MMMRMMLMMMEEHVVEGDEDAEDEELDEDATHSARAREAPGHLLSQSESHA